MVGRGTSFILTAKNEGKWLKHTLDQVLSDLPSDGEVIVLDEGSTDGSTAFLKRLRHPGLIWRRTRGLGVARARNAAALLAHGEFLVFIDSHMILPNGWWTSLVALAANAGVGAVQPCVVATADVRARGYGERFAGPDLTLEWLPQLSGEPYPVPVLCGCSFVLRRSLFLSIGGLDGGMEGWGSEDCELSIRLWRLGYEVWIDPRVAVQHRFRTDAPYEINWAGVLYNRLRLAVAHFTDDRLARTVDSIRSLPRFQTAFDAVMRSDAWQMRAWLDRQSIRCDDSFLRFSNKVF